MRQNISICVWLLFLLAGAASNSASYLIAQQPSRPSEPDDLEAKQVAFDYLTKTEARIVQLEKFVSSVKSTADKMKIPFGKLMSTERDIKQIAQKLKLAREASNDIELDQQSRASIKRRGRQLAKRLIDADEVLWPLRYHLSSALDPRAYLDLKNDAKRLQGIANMYADPDVFLSEPGLAVEIFQQAKPAALEFQRVIKKYDRLIEQQTTAGRQLDGLRRYFESKLKSFLAAAEAAKPTTALQLKKEIDGVIESLDSAKSQPAIAETIKTLPLRIASIDDQVKLLSVLSAKDTSWQTDHKTLNAKLVKFVAGLQSRQLPLNALPDDNYQEKNREEIISLMKSVSLANSPDSELVSVRIPDAKWKRRTVWKFVPAPGQSSPVDSVGGRWSRDDVSVLKVCLLTVDPANRDAVLVKRYRVERLHQTNGSTSDKAVEISNSFDSGLRYLRPR